MTVRHVPIEALQEGIYCDSVYHVRRRQIGTAKTGKAFLTLILGDKTGEITARIFNNAEVYANSFVEGDFLYVQGRVQIYEGRLQIVADSVERIAPADINPDDFLPGGRRDSAVLLKHLRDILESVGDEKIRTLCLSALEGDIGAKLVRAPAAQTVHHSYIGGLLEHTLSMMMILDFLSGHYHNINRDILLAGGLFHDIGKIRELQYDTAFGYTDEGRLIPHLIIGVQIVDRLCASIPDFSDDARMQIQHIILSHHGTREFGSPVLPSTVEALIIHLVDDLDAKTNTFLTHIEKAPPDADWTDRHFILGQHLRRTVDTKGPLYGYRLPGEEKNETPAPKSEPVRHAKKSARSHDLSGRLFDLPDDK